MMTTETYSITLEQLPDDTWYAVFDDDEQRFGYGETRHEALMSLVERLEDIDEEGEQS